MMKARTEWEVSSRTGGSSVRLGGYLTERAAKDAAAAIRSFDGANVVVRPMAVDLAPPTVARTPGAPVVVEVGRRAVVVRRADPLEAARLARLTRAELAAELGGR